MKAPDAAQNTREALVLLPWLTWFSHVREILSALTMSGPTENRPTSFLWVGRPYWDETLQKPVYLSSSDPNVWKDAAGGVA